MAPPSSSPSPSTVKPEDHNQHVPDPLAHFTAIPWCAAHLADPSVLKIAVPDRRPLASGESSFVRRTMNSGTTVRACVTFFSSPAPAPQEKGEEPRRRRRRRRQGEKTENADEKEHLLSGAAANGEDPRSPPFLVVSALLDLGEDCNSFVGTMHGGLYGVLMDEVMGTAANFQAPHGAYTARFETEYRRPVRPPEVVLVRGRVARREGRKIWVRGTIEDKDGNIMAEGSGLWLSMSKNVGRSQL